MAYYGRTRYFDESTATTASFTHVNDPPTTPYSQTIGNGWTGKKTTVSDTEHPGWRKLQRIGYLTLSDFSLVRETRTMSNSTLVSGLYPHWGTRTFTGDITANVEPSCPAAIVNVDMAKQASVALAKALAKVESADVLGGEIVSDLDKTLLMLRHPLGKSRELLRKMHKMRTRNLGKTTASAARASANAWLEYRYGWKPILLDMHSIYQAAHKLREQDDRQRLVVRATESSVGANRITTWTDREIAPGGLFVSGQVCATVECRTHAGVIYEVESRTTQEKMQKMLGYRPADLVETLWEIIPYSFVADWFGNVGTWLGAIVPKPGVKILGKWTTSVYVITKNYSSGTIKQTISFSPEPARTYYGTYGGSVYTKTMVTRDVNPSVATVPEVKGTPLSLLQTCDGLSLMTEKILSSLKSFR